MIAVALFAAYLVSWVLLTVLLGYLFKQPEWINYWGNLKTYGRILLIAAFYAIAPVFMFIIIPVSLLYEYIFKRQKSEV